MKFMWKYVFVGVMTFSILTDGHATQPNKPSPDILTPPKIEKLPKPQTAEEAATQLQGTLMTLCEWFVPVAEYFGITVCTSNECNTPAGFNHCMEKVFAWLDPDVCNNIASDLYDICDNACTRFTCLKSGVLNACKTVCCPLNRGNIQGCLGKKESCPFPAIHCWKKSSHEKN